MAQLFLGIIDLTDLCIIHVKLNGSDGTVQLIVGHEKHNMPVFVVDMSFLHKVDGEWVVDTIFVPPKYVSISSELEDRVQFYIKGIFGPMFSEYVVATDLLAELEEKLEAELAYLSV